MKKINRFISVSLLVLSSLSLLGCGRTKTIKNKQAQQILLMILNTQVNNTEFVTEYEKRGEISYRYTGNGDDLYVEISLSNKIIHRYSEVEDIPDTWYYMSEGILYKTVKHKNGDVVTSYRDGGDEESYAKDFDTYYVSHKSEIIKLIKEVDKPLAYQERLDELENLNREKVKSKFVTTKDGNLNATVAVYEDNARKHQSYQYSFVYEGNLLSTYTYLSEKEAKEDYYSISYETRLSRDLIPTK